MNIVVFIFAFLAVSSNAAYIARSEANAESNVEEESSQQISEAAEDTGESRVEFTGQEDGGFEDGSGNPEAEEPSMSSPPEDTNLASVPEDETPVADVKSTEPTKVSAVSTKNLTTVPQKKSVSRKSASPSKESLNGQVSALDLIPYPINLIVRTFGKDVLKNLDVETVCDAAQLIDWKKYRKLLEEEDFIGFSERISKDEILVAAAEAMQQTSKKYINKMIDNITHSLKLEGVESMQKSVRDFFEIVSLSLGNPKDGVANIQNDIKKIVETIPMDKIKQKEALENMQKNVDKLLAVLSTVKARNSL